MRALCLALLLAAACGKSDSKKEPSESGGDCAAACEHTMELAVADIEKNMAALGDPEATARLLAEAAKTRDSDLATCVSHCKAGKLDPACALAAKTIDGAMSCTGGATGRAPVEPPAERSDEDWPKATLRAVSDQVGGVTFTLKIPTELQEQEADRSDTTRGWDFPNLPFSQPRFRVGLVDEFPKTAEAGLAYYGIDERKKVVRQEHTGDRFVLLYEADTYVVAQVIARAGERGVDCYGTHSGRNLTRKDVIGPWLLEVCSTLTVATVSAPSP
jgi:hypothetical protein